MDYSLAEEPWLWTASLPGHKCKIVDAIAIIYSIYFGTGGDP